MPFFTSPSEKDFEKFFNFTFHGYAPNMNYLYVYEKNSPLRESSWYWGGALAAATYYRAALLAFTDKELIVKKIPDFRNFNEKDFPKNLLRIPNKEVKNFSTNEYGGKYYISFTYNGTAYEYYLSKHFRGQLKFVLENFDKLLINRFHGLLKKTDNLPTVTLKSAKRKSPLEYLRLFTNLYFIISTFIAIYVFKLDDYFFVAAAGSALLTTPLTYLIGTNPSKWTTKDKVLQALCIVLIAASICLYIACFLITHPVLQ